ncbi:MAG: RecQ family zinc-binding domain-containing protein, partial [Pirellulales bacterium]|nr:RecQ family zinc-binding domain-containing protein [Pirellulales bacterium]
LPKALENYVQEIGRAGRDGHPSVCELFACSDDVVTLTNFTYGDTPTEQSVAGMIGDVLGRGEEFDVSVYELSGIHDIRPIVVKTLLAYLELEGILQSTAPFYSQYKFQPQKDSREMLEQFDADRAAFLRSVFRHAVKGRIWFSLDLEKVSRAIGQPRQRLVAAIGYLEERGDLIVQAAGVRQGFRMLSRPSDPAALCARLSQRFDHREKHEITRLDRVLEYAEEEGCWTRHLLEYFGEQHGECGHCGRCEGQSPRPIAPAGRASPTKEQMLQLDSLLSERHKALASPRQVTRFLCGLSSPATTRAKLRSHRLFGAFDSMPFHDVVTLVENIMQS